MGWEPVFTELQVDKSNEQSVKETVARCQTMLQQLLQAALSSGQQVQPPEFASVAPVNQQQVRHLSGTHMCFWLDTALSFVRFHAGGDVCLAGRAVS